MDKVGLTGEVTDVAVSDDSLLSVSNAAGQWMVAALESFATTEWMRVTIGGIAYEITVTDDRLISVAYVMRSWDGSKVVATEKTVDAQPVPADGNMTSGTYYLNSNVTKSGRVESITGDVDLILGNGYTLDVRDLYIPKGSTLTIYAQSEGDNAGKLRSHPSGGAAIGGYSGHDNGNIVIHGGTIDATGYNNCAGIGSNDGRTGGSVTIYGGTVTATGGGNGAGIGGGRRSHSGTITITGGEVYAHYAEGGSGGGAAIGAGACEGASGLGGRAAITGGTVKAVGVSRGRGSAIGAGMYNGGVDIEISGGNVTATGGHVSISVGYNGHACNTTLSWTDESKATIWQADVPDYGVVAEYLRENLNGVVGEAYANPYGQGRIVAVG